ncbi:hypothetical protein FAZ19_18235 [Sphingobacterium alkalisoli]|uniref:F5/8 type C domain-containing protein n=1 Tax=Sphingobacterium alkalisoli TaxID=1874115 RepID=A0A4U0GWP0_9SPHI|nr:family 43 glycosylhydrolase [Sphingobacterium alkalisoli]TJY63517.1 hypothetical protein FAZ19_18235 [Sphingobacterium alkalisoli]GGH26582.1 hypothetical protein GCM10011418_35920 [Sphingobacterium alkalisoli]
MKQIFKVLILFLCSWVNLSHAQQLKKHQQPGHLNPILPGYFADPTIKKIGDTYYIYATTDGNGWGAGPSQVWTSEDFINWTIQPMNWPNTHWYWAPDMTKGYDGRYYLYYSQPVEIFGAVSDSPVGPWEPLVPNGKSIIPNYMIPGVITLDAQTFTDDDGKMYMYWGTWGIYPDHGCAVGLLNHDMKSFEKIELIPNTVAIDFFEAPYVFKRNGVYYFMYSSGHCEDHSYRVQYAKSKVGPMGPFEYPDHNPILVTNTDGTIHGPGHHSILEVDGRYFIVYHRHNNPHSGGGFHRQVAIDELFFNADGDIKNIVPTHEGIKDLSKPTSYPEDRAFGKSIEVSSYYNDDFKPSFAVDDNNGTLWRAKENQQPAWISVDLGKSEDVQTVEIQFEYPTYAYQYTLETSEDGEYWTTFADQSVNNRWASPVLEHGKAKARYVRLKIWNTQLPGLPRGVWNISVYNDRLKKETIWSAPQSMPSTKQVLGNLIHLQASDYREGQRLSTIQNKGLLGEELKSEQQVLVKQYQGKQAFFFDGSVSFRSTFGVPQSLEGNSPYTVAMWINNPSVDRLEHVLTWSKGSQDMTRAIFGVGSDPQRGAVVHGSWPDLGYKTFPVADQWHYVVIGFDGYMERIYVDGIMQSEQNRMLYVRGGDAFVVGASDLLDNNFSGYLADLKVYNENMPVEVIKDRYAAESETTGYFAIQTDDLDLGPITLLKNHGSVNATAISIDGAVVRIIGQRTALEINRLQHPLLQRVLAKENYTLEFDLFDGKKWNHYMLIHRQGKAVCFKNGELGNLRDLKKLFAIEDQSIFFKTAFHFFNAYEEGFSAGQATARYRIWQEKSMNSLTVYTPSLFIEPYYVNDKDVFVQVEEDKKGLLYLFSCGGISSGWVKQSYYLFDKAEDYSAVRIYAKDEFGNVSKVLEAAANVAKPTLLPNIDVGGIFRFPEGKIPFWDGYQVSSYSDSTQTVINLDQQVWRIGSKHTKWGDNDLVPPFVYKELQGDFTVEVKVRDVTGLSTQARSSSEAGIMIQDVDDPLSYINNTILTGWNLGNLARSVGPRIHREGNTGTGLIFDSFIQIQRSGKYFYLRSSKDGKTWTNLPNTPFVREDLNGRTLKVGLYQIATNNQEGFGEFEEVRIYLR